MTPEKTPSTLACPHCSFVGALAGLRFCPNCGESLPQAGVQITQIKVDQQVGQVQGGGEVTGVKIGQVLGNVIVASDAETQARRRRDLRILLDKVRSFWVDGVLKHSFQGADLIELGKALRPEAVERPWEDMPGAGLVVAEPSPDKKIAELFGDLDHALLILDGVGAGKTISLLELAREGIGRAESDPLQPVPVVFNLSSWTPHERPIADWVVEELSARYQIPARLGRQWLDDNLLALLLDGLDEVEAERRSTCIAALNEFRREYGLVQIGVCSRTEAYEAAGARLKLSGAILLQPLTVGQIEDYLTAAGPQAEALRTVLHEDAALQGLAGSPMMLNMMRLAYRDVPLEVLRSGELSTHEARRELLLEQYVHRMFQQVVGTKAERYPQTQATRWLVWLAQGMARHHQSQFRIEGLQPSWLPDRAQQWLYAALSRMIAGLVLGLGSVAWGFLLPGLLAPAWGYLLVGLLGGLVVGLADALRFAVERRNAPSGADPQPSPRRRVWDVLAVVLSATLVLVASYLLVSTRGWIFGLKEGLMFGLMFGLILGLRTRVGGADQDTRSVEALAWSPAGSSRGALAGLGAGLLIAVAYGAVAWFVLGRQAVPENVLISTVLIFGPTLALIGGILGGLRGTIVETKTFPNQGTWLSARNALWVGLAVGLAGGLGEGLINILIGRVLGKSSAGLGTVLVAGLFWAIVAGLWYGGLDLIKHFTLRLILRLGGHVPWRYARFLDYAVQLRLLQRAGGSFLFANRLVQEYFAEIGGDRDGHAT
jgi:eukaryotic-like serine/threonine-protein kinase